MQKFISILFLSCVLFCACESNLYLEPQINKSLETTRSVEVDSVHKEIITLSSGITIAKIGEEYYLSEDILLSEEQVAELNQSNARSAVLNNAVKYWKDGIVYYTIDENFNSPSNAIAAMNAISEATSVRFQPRQSWHPDYINFKNHSSNNSYLGKTGGKQDINIYNYQYVGIIIHEICHALGIYHEQCRSDRDNYVSIYSSNISSGSEHNFQIYGGGLGFDIGAFDFNSIMLYSSYDFSKNGAPTMVKKDGSTFIGQRYALSAGDILGIESIYGPPFAKIEKVETYYEERNYYADEYVRIEHDVYLKFYSDRTYESLQALQ